jgi:hypothetical protein
MAFNRIGILVLALSILAGAASARAEDPWSEFVGAMIETMELLEEAAEDEGYEVYGTYENYGSADIFRSNGGYDDGYGADSNSWNNSLTDSYGGSSGDFGYVCTDSGCVTYGD